MYVDTHLHLDEPWLTDPEKRKRVIEDITAHRIPTFAQSCDLASYEKILECANQSDYVIPSFGILPWYANEYTDRLDEVAELCESAVMLGEIGLDLASSRNTATREEQLALLDVFLEAAKRNDMVLNLHFRGGMEPVGLEVLKDAAVQRAIFHWYSGTLDLMDEINKAGFYYSVGQMHLPRRTQEKRDEIAAMVRKIPDDRLLLEIDVLPQDSESLPSTVFRGVLEDVAKIKGMSPDEIEALNQTNVRELVGDGPRVAEIIGLLGSS